MDLKPEMSGKVFGAYNKLEKSLNRVGASEEGKVWVEIALDPFADRFNKMNGYPDKTMEPSFTEVVKQTVTVGAPGVANWDCSIFLDQCLALQNLRQTALAGNALISTGQGVTDFSRGGVCVRKGAAGATLDITSTDNASCLGVDITQYANEDARIVSIGIEVHDTTQDLKKQGSVVVWRLDQPVEEAFTQTVCTDAGITACIPASVNTVVVPAPPFTQSQATDMVGSLQWEAREGCYLVPILVSDTNPPLGLRGLGMQAVEGANRFFPVITNVGAANLKQMLATNVTNPWCMTGAFFTGLDPAAELTINFNYVIERFPNRVSTFRRLAQPSPKWDVPALELYSEIVRKLPVGTIVRQNGFGDWISGIANIAASVLKMIPHPVPQLIGTGLGVLAGSKAVKNGINNLTEKKQEKAEVQCIKKDLKATGVAPQQAAQIANHAVQMSHNTSTGSNVKQGNYGTVRPRNNNNGNAKPYGGGGKKANRKPYPGVMVPMNPWMYPNMRNGGFRPSDSNPPNRMGAF